MIQSDNNITIYSDSNDVRSNGNIAICSDSWKLVNGCSSQSSLLNLRTMYTNLSLNIDGLSDTVVTLGTTLTDLENYVDTQDASILSTVGNVYETKSSAAATEASIRTDLSSQITSNGNSVLAEISENYYTKTTMDSSIANIESTLTASVGVNSARLSTVESVSADAYSWSASASKLIQAPDGSITGWEFADGSDAPYGSEFKITADNIIMTGTTTFLATGDAASDINSGTTTINGSNITTGTLTADKLDSEISLTTNGYIVANGNHTNTGGVNAAISANENGGAAAGVWGLSSSASKGGVMGINNNSSGYGTYGFSSGGRGVFGSSVDGQGVYGFSSSSYGVYGFSTYSNGGYFKSSNSNGLYAQTSTSTQSAIQASNTASGTTAYLSHQNYGLYTAYDVYVGGTVNPFTGSHRAYTQDYGLLMIGDIVESSDAWVVNINQTLVHVKQSSTSKSTKVFGVINAISDNLGFAFDNPLYSNEVVNTETKLVNNPDTDTHDEITIETSTWEIKPEYAPYIDYMTNNGFREVGCNSVGEGGINVCEANGDILNGDYICTSNIAGKCMKQDDDLLHNYTVAKAMEDVTWANETVGEAGVFMQDGVKCKMIACTYHCG